MDIHSKLRVLADAAKYDASCASSGSHRARATGGIGNTEGCGICHSYTPDGRCVSLLKVLFTNNCIYDCLYCINRISNDVPRASFTVTEIVRLTLDFYTRNYIEGLFLSSGIVKNPDHTFEQLVCVARTLRQEHSFGGYIHLKAIPGASPELLQEAGRWADRLSANIELPLDEDLVRLAPAKSLRITEQTMEKICQAEVRNKPPVAPTSRALPSRSIAVHKGFLPAGQTTQMLVGATDSSDTVLLSRANRLYKQWRLRRVFYSAYSPIPNPSSLLPSKPAPLMREHRLYQADWLGRFYGFRLAELTTPQQPNLDLDIDPKLSWALRNRHMFPVNINTAPKNMLLRVPGFGTRSVNKLIAARVHQGIRFADLRALGVAIERAKYFIITLDEWSATRLLDTTTLQGFLRPKPKQLSLF